jgi:hypothetical protein
MFWLVEAQYKLVRTWANTRLIPVHVPGIYLPYTQDQDLFQLFSKPRGQGIIEIFYTLEGINFIFLTLKILRAAYHQFLVQMKANPTLVPSGSWVSWPSD